MAKSSRNERRKRQVKRTNSLLKRQLRGLSVEANKAYLALITILAQKGGEITVTRGTMQQAANDLLTLGFSVSPGADEQDLVIRLVTNSAVGEASPAGDIEVDESDIVPAEEESDALPTLELPNGASVEFSNGSIDLAGLESLPDDGAGNMIILPNEETRYVDPNVDGNVAEVVGD